MHTNPRPCTPDPQCTHTTIPPCVSWQHRAARRSLAITACMKQAFVPARPGVWECQVDFTTVRPFKCWREIYQYIQPQHGQQNANQPTHSTRLTYSSSMTLPADSLINRNIHNSLNTKPLKVKCMSTTGERDGRWRGAPPSGAVSQQGVTSRYW